jgi:hypothetical protein
MRLACDVAAVYHTENLNRQGRQERQGGKVKSYSWRPWRSWRFRIK